MDDITITYLVLGAVVVLFVAEVLPVEVTALGASLALYATGVLDLDQSLSGFGDPAVILIAALFVVSEALDATGVTTWMGQEVIARARGSARRLLVLIMLLVAFLTALISVNGAVASLLPMVVVIAVRSGTAPSRLLMPLAFGAHAGSMLALTGTPVNVLVSDAAVDAGVGSFGFFEFTLAGVPLVIGTVATAVVLGPRLLADRTPDTLPPDLGRHAETLAQQYLRDRRVYRLRIRDDSRCIGSAERDLDLAPYGSLSLVGVQVDGVGRPRHPPRIGSADVLIVQGEAADALRLATDLGLRLDDEPFSLGTDGDLMDRRLGVVEVVIPPRSELIGETVFPGMVTESGDLIVLAVHRAGEPLDPVPTALDVGDVLLLQGRWAELTRHLQNDPAVLAVDAPDLVRRQAVPLGPGSTRALAILAVMVVLLATGAVPAAVAGLLAAGALVVSGVLTMPQAYRGISWTTVVLVAAMLPLSTAMSETGAADEIASLLVDVVGDAGPHALLFGLFALVAVLGQLISNTATAVIVIPIALSAAAELDISARPVLMCLAVATSAALLTPVATPANLMILQPGGYRFTDYARFGAPLLVLYGLVAVLLVPVFWRF